MPASMARPVVVVEDDTSVSSALTRILRLAGGEPVVFPSAEAFLDSGDPWNASCLIIDVQLPGLDGFALCEKLASARPLPPVIFMTAFDEPEARARAAAVGAYAFLTKPFSGRSLLDVIEQATGSPFAPMSKGAA